MRAGVSLYEGFDLPATKRDQLAQLISHEFHGGAQTFQVRRHAGESLLDLRRKSRRRRLWLRRLRGGGLSGFGFLGPEDLGGQLLRLAQVPGQDVSRVLVPIVRGFGLGTRAGGFIF